MPKVILLRLPPTIKKEVWDWGSGLAGQKAGGRLCLPATPEHYVCVHTYVYIHIEIHYKVLKY